MKNFLPILAILFLSLISIRQAHATHAQGGSTRYEYLGDSTYALYLEFYWNCGDPANPFPAGPPSSANIFVSSSSCNQNLGSFNAPLFDSYEVTDLQCGTSTCNGGNEPGTILYIFKTIVKLPMECPDWTFEYSLCCRNGSISNLDSPDSYSLYTVATLNNTNGVNNSTPIFVQSGVPGLCELSFWEFTFGAVDFDGDSLVYELVQPLDDASNPIPYVPPFSPTYPFETVQGTISFDPATGYITGQPVSGFQMAVISVIVHEWRDGVEVGTVSRDIQVITNPNCTTIFFDLENKANHIISGVESIAYDADSNEVITITGCVGQELHFVSEWEDISTNPVGLEGTSNASVLNIDDVVVEYDNSTFGELLTDVKMNLTSADTGLHDFVLYVALDENACDIRQDSILFRINVVENLELGEDLIYCSNGDSVEMTNNDAGNITWSLISGGYPEGLSSDTINHPLAAPTETRTYVAISDIDEQCKNIDTITVVAYPVFDLPDTIYSCWDDSLIILPEWLDSASMVDYVSYLWIDGTKDSVYIRDENTQNSDSSRYVGVVLEDTTCVVTDTAWVEFIQCFLEIPNVFTPNGDSVNDIFELRHFDLGKWDLMIYNRWGRKVYGAEPYMNDWNGDDAANGMYYYKLSHRELRLEYNGWFTISRETN